MIFRSSTNEWWEQTPQETEFEQRELLAFLRKTLTDREFRVIIGYFYLGKTLPEISDEFMVTRERIRQIKVVGIRKITRSLKVPITEMMVQYNRLFIKELKAMFYKEDLLELKWLVSRMADERRKEVEAERKRKEKEEERKRKEKEEERKVRSNVIYLDDHRPKPIKSNRTLMQSYDTSYITLPERKLPMPPGVIYAPFDDCYDYYWVCNIKKPARYHVPKKSIAHVLSVIYMHMVQLLPNFHWPVWSSIQRHIVQYSQNNEVSTELLNRDEFDSYTKGILAHRIGKEGQHEYKIINVDIIKQEIKRLEDIILYRKEQNDGKEDE